jgi:hypothetical protein
MPARQPPSGRARFPSGKPPFHARNERDRRWMRTWMFDKLERLFETTTLYPELFAEVPLADWPLHRALVAAERTGDLTELRDLYPKLAHWLNPPPRKHGGQSVRPGRVTRVGQARKTVPFIRKIWRDNYGMTRRMPPYDETAEELAAAFWQKFSSN